MYFYRAIPQKNKTLVLEKHIAKKGIPIKKGVDYYAFGNPMPGRTFNSTAYSRGFNGQEKDDEVYGAGNLNTALFWEYDTRLGRRWNVDPVVKPHMSSYSCFSDNPIFYKDIYGNTPGDYYNKEGEHLGSDGKKDDKVYVADNVTKDKNGLITNATNAVDLGVTHTDFSISSNVVKHESGGGKEEALWIAHTANNAKDNDAIDFRKQNATLKDQLTDPGYSTTPAEARTSLIVTDQSQSANNARAAVINVHTGGADPTGGAVLWDGTDFLSKGTKHNKFKEYANVQVSNSILMKHFEGVENYRLKFNKPFNVDISTFSTPILLTKDLNLQGNSKRNYNVIATGAQGASIFWSIQQK